MKSLLSVFAAVFLATSRLQAQTAIYWDPSGASGAFGGAANYWDGSSLVAPSGVGTVNGSAYNPLVFDDAAFANRKAVPTSMTAGASIGIGSLTYNNNFNGTNTTTVNNATTANITYHLGSGWSMTDNAGSGTVTFSKSGSGSFNFNLIGNGSIGATGGATIAFGSGTVIANDTAGTAGSITKIGAGTLSMNGANTYSGGTTLSTGTLNINHAAALGTGSFTISGGTIDNTSGAAISTSANNNSQSWNGDFSFAGSNDLNLGTGAVALAANRQITVNAGILAIGGAISGSGKSLAKAGAGTLALSGNNTFDGGTIIGAGTVRVDHSNALGPSAAAIHSGGTLAINNVTIGNALVLSSGSTVRGTGASNGLGGTISGTGSLSGPLTLTASALYAWNTGDSLTLASGAALTINPGFSLSLASLTTGSFATGSSQSWTVIDGRAGSITGTALNLTGISGTFSGLGSFGYTLGVDALTVNWTAAAIPEPSTFAVVLGLVALAGLRLRRRQVPDV